MKTRVVVLGAGFGGLELTTILSNTFGDAIDVMLVDKGDAFVFGFSKLDVMFGLAAAHCRPSSVSGHRQARRPIFPDDCAVDRSPVALRAVTDAGRPTPTCSSSRSAPTTISPPHLDWVRAAASSTRSKEPSRSAIAPGFEAWAGNRRRLRSYSSVRRARRDRTAAGRVLTARGRRDATEYLS